MTFLGEMSYGMHEWDFSLERLDSLAISRYTNPFHPYFRKEKNLAETKKKISSIQPFGLGFTFSIT